MTSVKLKAANLAQLSASIATPQYDRANLRPGIVHISLGAFHRAHQTVYADDLFNQAPENAEHWGICSVGALPHDEIQCRRLKGQDNLYTVVTRDEGHDQARIIGSIAKIMHAPSDPGGVLSQMADENTKIVSLTVTERGYGHDPATGKLDTNRSDVAADLMMPKRPKTAIGYVVEGLWRRREEGLPAFTVMSCDNLQKNGSLTRDLVIEFATKRDPALADWIAKNASFPNSMVDRITPATT
ncbi:MAG: mannitol dehydrogenase family protein, partial [Pseudomonadota bacterium]